MQTIFSVLILAVLILGQVSPTYAMETTVVSTQTGLQPKVSSDVHHDVSAALRDSATSAAQAIGQEEIPYFSLPKSLNAASGIKASVDSVLQNSPVSSLMPETTANFDGINNISGVAPPDTQGDLGYDPSTGKKYYMQWVNLYIQVWDVTDAANPVAEFANPIAGNAIWDGFGGRCESDNDGDPIVLFDETAGRWMISQFSVTSAPYYNCIAISKTADPAGEYYRYAFLYSNTKMNDYPKYGIWRDGYYMTVNQFLNGATWAGAGVAVYERDQMLVGNSARQVIFDLESVNDGFGGMLPADVEGTLPPVGTPAYFAEVDDSSYNLGSVDEMRIWQFNTNWATNTFTFGLSGQPNQILPVANYTPICSTSRDCVPQPNSQKLDAIGDRLMYRLAYRLLDDGTERMVVNHTVDATGTGRAGVRWYELEKTGANWAITQQSTYAGDNPASDTAHRWMGSISMDRMGNLAMGYSVSSSTVYPSIGIVGRVDTDPLNSLPQGERVAFSGSAAQSGVNRWGDYSSMSIDPEDGCTFWFTTEYSSGSWDWETRIVSFKYPSCTALPTGTISGTVTDSTTAAPIANAKVTAGDYGAYTAADGTYSIRLPEGTYTLSVSAFAYSPASVSDVAVVVDTVTTQDFVLGAANLFEVYGVVSDETTAGHTWPLYARITIAGYPGGDIYTDPVTGAYSIELPEGSEFDFTVHAIADGFSTASETLIVPSADTVLNFGLEADQTTCTAPGYKLEGGFVEKFDSVSAGTLPANWTSTVVTATDSPVWNTNAGTRYPSGVAAYSAPNVAFFNSFSVRSVGSARLAYSQPFDMTAMSTDEIVFQMYHDTGYSSSADTVQVQVSTNGTTWNNVGSPINRYATPARWTEHTVDLSAYSGATNLLVGFLAVSRYGNDIHIDDVIIGGVPECFKQNGSLVLGHVTDVNTSEAINGASVEAAGDEIYLTGPTDDPALEDGFYYGFAPEGVSIELTASKSNYVDDSVSISIADNATVQQDFQLSAGQLTVTPDEVGITIEMNQSDTSSLTIANTGSAAADFSIVEFNLPVTTLEPDLTFDPVIRHLGPKNLNKFNLDGIPYYWTPSRAVQQPYPLEAAGTLLSSFDTGLTYPWGVGYDPFNDTVWAGNIEAGGGDDLDYEFTALGVETGNTIDTSPWVSTWGADMTYDPIHNTLWQVNVGGDNCIYELSLSTYTPTGNKICPAFGTSERGLAYDPLTDTFFAGSWNNSIIVRFDREGTILQQVNVGLPIAGLAYNPSTGHLFVTTSGTAPLDINVLDVNDDYAQLGGFDVTELSGGQAGLEFDCDGHLWAANQDTAEMLEIDSGETGVCDYLDIPWLTENPVAGNIGDDDSTEVTLTFDATGLMPGDYKAQLFLNHNTPYGLANIPVTLTVIPEPDYGFVEGVISGLLACDATPGAPLANATVEIRNQADELVSTLMTDSNGKYSWLGLVSGNDYSLTIRKTGYVTEELAVTLVDQVIVVKDAALSLEAPCISANPGALETTVNVGGSTSLNLELTNSGYAASNFTIIHSAESESIVDGSFEQVIDSATWDTYSEAYGTPLCDEGSCGVGGGTGPRTGDYWMWFGGSSTGDVGYASQDVTINTGAATLEFWAEQATCGTAGAGNYLRVMVDSDEVWRTDGDDSACGTVGYRQITVDLSGYADGTSHTISFDSTTVGSGNFFVDDASLLSGGDVLWLSETPTTGVIPVDDSLDVMVNFNSTGMSFGDYQTFIHVVDVTSVSISIPVTMHVNSPAVAVNDVYTNVMEDTSLTVAAPGVLANDVNLDGDLLTAKLVGQPAHGTTVLNVDGSFTYTPETNWNGTDSFTYSVNDGFGDSAAATVTIEVVPVNDSPTAEDDTYTVYKNNVLTVGVPGVLGNDIDVDLDSMTVTLVSGVSHGTLTLRADGSFVYTPAPDFVGTDKFTYQLVTSQGGNIADPWVDTAEVTINILPGVPVTGDNVIYLPLVIK
jgi:hypothetical protein